ncbi:MAG: hypothetical protein NT078_00645 [Candidatus Azambacteria bacterium]|nr:hypothetical protein [Candidatus Azambacteria bacterium]
MAIPLAEERIQLPEGVAGKSCVEAHKRLEQIKIPTEAAVAVKNLSL